MQHFSSQRQLVNLIFRLLNICLLRLFPVTLLLIVCYDLLFTSKNVAHEVLILRFLARIVTVQELLGLAAHNRAPVLHREMGSLLSSRAILATYVITRGSDLTSATRHRVFLACNYCRVRAILKD